VLNGVGGKTIAEAKKNLTYVEAQSWMEYYKLRGTFNQNRKMEWGFALVAWMVNRANGGKAEMSDLMPYSKAPGDDLDEAMKILGGR
jgi:hypothetical protein